MLGQLAAIVYISTVARPPRPSGPRRLCDGPVACPLLVRAVDELLDEVAGLTLGDDGDHVLVGQEALAAWRPPRAPLRARTAASSSSLLTPARYSGVFQLMVQRAVLVDLAPVRAHGMRQGLELPVEVLALVPVAVVLLARDRVDAGHGLGLLGDLLHGRARHSGARRPSPRTAWRPSG